VAEPQQHGFQRGSDRILGGVCSGLAAGLQVDALWVRIAFVILAFFQGVGLFVYIVLWLVLPEQTAAGSRSGFDSVADDLRRVGAEMRAQLGGASAQSLRGSLTSQGVVLGVVLVIAGALLLAVNTGLVSWSVVWPLAVITIGIGFLFRGFGRRG
jgi:phage shock protein PspC (stress-responsive transcriptional regulator)